MRYEKIINILSEYDDKKISKNDLIDLYLRVYNNENNKTFLNFVSLLKKNKIIMDDSNDKYQILDKKTYSLNIDDELKKINDLITEKYPDIKHLTWTTGVINDFTQHYAITNYIVVETEKFATSHVMYLLKENLADDYVVLLEDMFVKNSEYYLNENKIIVIVKQLIQKAPLDKVDGIYIPSLEKIMVDLIKDKLFKQFQGSELRHIFENIFDDYNVNFKRLYSYADHRGVKDELEETINKLTLH